MAACWLRRVLSRWLNRPAADVSDIAAGVTAHNSLTILRGRLPLGAGAGRSFARNGGDVVTTNRLRHGTQDS
jgi:hypothetical protein